MQKEQIRSIEHTKLTLKKRKGVVPFVRVFPVSQAQSRGCSRARFHADLSICAPLELYVARVESQLDGSPGPNVRKVIDAQYDRVTAAIFDCLQQMAKMDGEGQGNEGKDQLNYHVILIGPSSHSLARALLRYMLLSGKKLTCVCVCVCVAPSQRTCTTSSQSLRTSNASRRCHRSSRKLARDTTRIWRPTFDWSYGVRWQDPW